MRGPTIKAVVVAAHILLIFVLYTLSSSDDTETDTPKPDSKTDKPLQVENSTGPIPTRPGSAAQRPVSGSNSSSTATNAHHLVKRGDNLSVIAKKYKTSVTNLKKWNSLNAKGTIFPGQKLVVSGN